MSVTIRDIAQELGMAHSTVSRAWRDDLRISPATREKVTRVAARMGYRVNVAARALSSGPMHSLALIILDVVDLFWAGIAKGVDAVTHERHYTLVLYITHVECEREAGMAPDPSQVVVGNFTEEGGRASGEALFAGPQSQWPTAVFAGNHWMAIGLLHSCTEWGVRVPQDLSTVGYDDIDSCRHLQPPLTTVHQPTAEMGGNAARLLIERMECSFSLLREMLLKIELVVRGSCTCIVRQEQDDHA